MLVIKTSHSAQLMHARIQLDVLLPSWNIGDGCILRCQFVHSAASVVNVLDDSKVIPVIPAVLQQPWPL